MGDDAAEQRVGGSRRLVGVGIEGVAGELGEVVDVGAGHGAGTGGDRVADLQLGERFAERVHAPSSS